MTKEKILEKLASIDKQKYGILELGLFGSYAKGTNTLDSDIDVLVKLDGSDSKIKYEKGMYFRFCALEELLQSLFPNTKIDLIEKGTFNYKFYNSMVREYKEKIKQEILESAIYV